MDDNQAELVQAELDRRRKQEAHYADTLADMNGGMNRASAIRKHGIIAVLASEHHTIAAEMSRGFVSDARFDRGSDLVIPRTDRSKTKKLRKTV